MGRGGRLLSSGSPPTNTGAVSRAVATKTTYPVLSNVLIDADGDTLKLAATNQEIGITSMIPAQVDEPGRVTVDARLLSEFVNTCPPSQSGCRWNLVG